jgi:hypothetical protein
MAETSVSRNKTSGSYDASLGCPWCGVVSSGPVNLFSSVDLEEGQLFFVTTCKSFTCGRTVLVEVKGKLDPGTTKVALVHPTPQATYSPPGVPADIARDFKEAKACAIAGHAYAAALVARRVLQAAARDIGATGNNLKEEIDAIPVTRIGQPLKDAAHEVRYIGNDAAHANAIDPGDVEHLMAFTEELLEALYVIPARVAAAKAKRTAPPPTPTE